MNVTDVNDNSPQFPPDLQPLDIEENRGIGSIVTRLTATDADRGSNALLSYSILNGDDLGTHMQCCIIIKYQ